MIAPGWQATPLCQLAGSFAKPVLSEVEGLRMAGCLRTLRKCFYVVYKMFYEINVRRLIYKSICDSLKHTLIF